MEPRPVDRAVPRMEAVPAPTNPRQGDAPLPDFLRETFVARVEALLGEGRARLALRGSSLVVTTRVPLELGRSYLFERFGEEATMRLRVIAPLESAARPQPTRPLVDLGAFLRAWLDLPGDLPARDAAAHSLSPESSAMWRSLLRTFVEGTLDLWLARWMRARSVEVPVSRATEGTAPPQRGDVTPIGDDGLDALIRAWFEHREGREESNVRRGAEGLPWRFEIPFLDRGELEVADLMVFPDAEDRTRGGGPATHRVLLHLSLRDVGALEIEVLSRGNDRVSASLRVPEEWVARFATELPRLQEALLEAGFRSAQAVIRPRALESRGSEGASLLDVLL